MSHNRYRVCVENYEAKPVIDAASRSLRAGTIGDRRAAEIVARWLQDKAPDGFGFVSLPQRMPDGCIIAEFDTHGVRI